MVMILCTANFLFGVCVGFVICALFTSPIEPERQDKSNQER